MTPAIPRAVSLYHVESELIELMTMADNDDLTPEERVAVEAQIAEYITAEVRKVDGVAAAVRICQRNAAIAKEEAERISKHAVAWEAREKRIKESALRAMVENDVTQLQTATNKLRVQGNGGLEPLEVDGVTESGETFDQPLDSVSIQFQEITVTLPLQQWIELGVEMATPSHGYRQKYSVNNWELRQALTRGPVEGAQLLPRGKHLRVE